MTTSLDDSRMDFIGDTMMLLQPQCDARSTFELCFVEENVMYYAA